MEADGAKGYHITDTEAIINAYEFDDSLPKVLGSVDWEMGLLRLCTSRLVPRSSMGASADKCDELERATTKPTEESEA